MKDSTWIKEAKWRQRNQWWLKPQFQISLKWYRMLRKIGIRK